MTPKTWNICMLIAMLSAIGLIGVGVALMVGLGAGLLAAGLSIFVCMLMIQRAMSAHRLVERD